MGQLQILFEEIREMKKERKDLRDMYKDALVQADNYEEICEEIKTLREKKKAIETRIQNQMGRAYDKMLELDGEIKTKKSMMNDVALNDYTKGDHVEVQDEFGNKYVPEFSVGFRKDYTGNTVE